VQDRRDEERIGEAIRLTVTRAGEVLADLMARPLQPALYLVATPIGNLADVSLRALAILARADLIAAEDTRHSKKLLSHFGLRAELTPYHEHNAEKERPRLLARLRAGQSVALISDAGTPLVSDPGYKLVREALDDGLTVVSIPGPSASLAALTTSGLPTDTFLFAGFLPAKGRERRDKLSRLAESPWAIVLYESPHRRETVTDLHDTCGPHRRVVIARELTKLHEETWRGTLAQAVEHLAALEPRGEFVLVLEARPVEKEEGADAAEILGLLIEELPLKQAVSLAARITGAKRNDLYALALTLKI